MSLAALPLLFRRYASMADAVRQILLRIVLNICLIQAWFPWQSLRYSMNNLSWFLSCMTFLYFMFPYLLRAGEKIVAKQRGPAAVLAVICGMMLYGILADMVCGSFSMEAGLLQGMTYNFPVFRLGDFFTGCLAGLLFKERKKDRTDVSDRVAVSVIFATLFLLIWPLIPWNGILESGDGVYLWWPYSDRAGSCGLDRLCLCGSGKQSAWISADSVCCTRTEYCLEGSEALLHSVQTWVYISGKYKRTGISDP